MWAGLSRHTSGEVITPRKSHLTCHDRDILQPQHPSTRFSISSQIQPFIWQSHREMKSLHLVSELKEPKGLAAWWALCCMEGHGAPAWLARVQCGGTRRSSRGFHGLWGRVSLELSCCTACLWTQQEVQTQCVREKGTPVSLLLLTSGWLSPGRQWAVTALCPQYSCLPPH